MCLACRRISNQLEPGAPAPSARVGIFYTRGSRRRRTTAATCTGSRVGCSRRGAVASSFYPVRGVYSSADALVVDAQMREIAASGIGVVITSWWGRGSREDRRLPQLLGAARRHGLSVAAHLEPYRGRTVESTEADIGYLRGLGISDVYVWASSELPDVEWAAMNARIEGVRVFANTNLAGRAAAGGFDGLYTYDVLLFDGVLFPRLCQPGASAASPVRTVGRPGLRRPARDRRRADQAATRRRALRRTCGAARCAPRQTSSRSRATTSGTRAPRSSRRAATGAATSRTRAPGDCMAAQPRRPTWIAPPSGCSASCAADDVRRAARHECVEEVGGLDAAERVVRGVDLDLRPGLEPERARPLVRSEAEQPLGREDTAPAGLTAGDPLQLPQLLERVDADVRVRADRERDPAVIDSRGGEEAVREVCLGRRARADRGAALGEQVELGAVGVRRVDDSGVRTEAAGAGQQLDRAAAVLRETLLDLARLLAGVDVQRQPSAAA